MKIFKLSLFILFLLTLVSCQTNGPTFDQIESELKLIYEANEDSLNVKSNITIPAIPFTSKEVQISWISSDETHAKISDYLIVITKSDDIDIHVTITAHVTIQKKSQDFTFDIIILKNDVTPIVLHDVTVIDGDISNIKAVEDGHFVELDEPTKTGFTFGGYFTDSNFTELWQNSPITSDITLYIKWVINEVIDSIAPVITGTKDLYVSLGDSVDYLYGIQVTDNLDSSPLLSVDDSQVDLTTVGEYPLTYTALDDSDNETVIVVTVHVEAVQLLEFVETFELIDNTGSSYVDGTYQGIDGILWTYSGMRSDQVLDGKAVTFGANSSNYIKADFQGGISSLSIQFSHAFSGSSVREIELYINHVLVHTFQVSSSQTTYVVSDINASGNFSFELKNKGGQRVTIDNITILRENESQDAKDIQSDIKNFSFPSHVMEPTTLQLINTGQKGSIITYRYKDSNNADNSFFDLNTGVITTPVDRLAYVIVEVIFSKGEEQKILEKTVIIGEGEPLTISDVSNSQGLIKTRGVLTGFVLETTFIRGFIQDSTGAVEVRFSLDSLSSLEINKAYVLKATVVKSPYLYLENVTSLDKKEIEVIDPIWVNVKTIQNHVSKLIYVEGILGQDYVSGDAWVVTENGKIAITIKDQNNPLVNQKVGQEIYLVGHAIYVEGNYKIWVLDSNLIEIDLFNEALFESYILQSLDLDKIITTQENITLPEQESIFSLNVIWTSSREDVLSSEGIITLPEEEKTLTLTYVLSNNTRIIYTGTLTVTVLPMASLSTYYKDAEGKTGLALLTELTKIISRNYHSISYSSTNKVLEKSDRHPSGQGYLGIYDHISITSYNKEHVWPQSSFSKASPYVSDMHHLRISNSNTNSTRSNYYFNDPTSPTTKWQVGSSRFFPGDLDKGDIARMLMYMAVRYRNDNFKLIVKDSGRTSDAPSRTMGNLAVLYDWHLDDPVDDFERNRNQVIFETQANRNPFIDHPELFDDIWDVFMAEDQQRRSSSERLSQSDFTFGETKAIDDRTYFVRFDEDKKRYIA